MRQSRDGAIELVDRSPEATQNGDLMSAISRLGWETVLVWYMRTLAWVWVAKGLFHWAIILGALPTLGQFTTMALPLQATIVAFACLDLLAAIGLWLAAAWVAPPASSRPFPQPGPSQRLPSYELSPRLLVSLLGMFQR